MIFLTPDAWRARCAEVDVAADRRDRAPWTAVPVNASTLPRLCLTDTLGFNPPAIPAGVISCRLVTSWYPLVPATKQAHSERSWKFRDSRTLRARSHRAGYGPACTRPYLPVTRHRVCQ